MNKAGAKAASPKPLNYLFENPSLTVGLAALNATDLPFTPKKNGRVSLLTVPVTEAFLQLRRLWAERTNRLNALLPVCYHGYRLSAPQTVLLT